MPGDAAAAAPAPSGGYERVLYASLAGVVSGAAVAPALAAVDQAVTQAANGKRGVFSSLGSILADYVRRPASIVSKPVLMVAGVYGATYAAANSLEVASSWALQAAERREKATAPAGEHKPAQRSLLAPNVADAAVAGKVAKFTGTTAVNMSAR